MRIHPGGGGNYLLFDHFVALTSRDQGMSQTLTKTVEVVEREGVKEIIETYPI